MNRFTATLVAAITVVAVGGPARADRAQLALRTGAVSISLSADDAPATVEADADLQDGYADANPFVPDVYPSLREAARGAAERWAAVEPLRWRQPPAKVRVMSEDPSLFAPVREGIRARRPSVRVEPCHGALCAGGGPTSREAWLYVTLFRGGVSVRSAGWSDATVSTQHVDKPWVSNFAGFAARTPGRWLVAHSDFERPATNPAEAARQARLAAVDQVVPLVTARLRGGRSSGGGAVRRVVETHLLGDRLVDDRFPQQYARPYGNLYRESVLIDASDQRVDALARDVRRSLEAQRHARFGGLASAGAVLLVTYALYRFANAFTRGYFTWSLRTAAAVVAAGVVTLIVAAA